MNLLDFLFYFFAFVTVLSAGAMVCARNAVNAAMFMIVSIIGIAALFAILEAFFLFAIQILVYAGAVIVLFLFIIMLLDVPQAAKKKRELITITSSGAAGLALLGGVLYLFGPEQLEAASLPPVTQGSTLDFGREMFTRMMLPFQVVGFMLLIALVGVIQLSKKPKQPETRKATAEDSAKDTSIPVATSAEETTKAKKAAAEAALS